LKVETRHTFSLVSQRVR